MERSREARRTTTTTASGLLRRRQRNNEDGVTELQEAARFRGGANRREASGLRKRCIGRDRFMNGSIREESPEEEFDDEERNGGKKHNQRRRFPPARYTTALKFYDEMIGVAVPRKARSASAKRLHECWNSDSISSKKKMKNGGHMNTHGNVSNPSSRIQDDIEIEVAEVLYGLMIQSQSSKLQQKLDSKDANDFVQSEKQESEEDNSAISIQNGSISEDLKLLPPENENLKLDLQMASEEESREEKLKIDITVPHSLSSFSERDEFTGSASDPNLSVQYIEIVEPVVKIEEQVAKHVKNEVVSEDMEELKSVIREEKGETREPPAGLLKSEQLSESKLELAKHDHGMDGDSSIKLQQQAQSSSSLFMKKFDVKPDNLPPLGCLRPIQLVPPSDTKIGPSPEVETSESVLSKHRRKRCATHHYIASNIYHHKEFLRKYPLAQEAAGSASLKWTNTYNLNSTPSSETVGKFQGGASSPTQNRGKSVNPTPRRQQVLQQNPQPVPSTDNLLNGPAYMFPMNQRQAAVAAKAPVSSNYPKFQTSETPYLAILQNNGYPFPIQTRIATPPAFKEAHIQAIPFFNGPFYASQMFHPSQLHQHNTSTSSGSSPPTDTHPPHAQNNFHGHNMKIPKLPPSFTLMHSNQSEKQQGLKGGTGLIHPQAFAISFPQNPAIFQSLSDMARHGYQANSMASTGPSLSTIARHTVTDGSARSLNWSTCSSSRNSQQQLMQLQTLHMMQLPSPSNSSVSKSSGSSVNTFSTSTKAGSEKLVPMLHTDGASAAGPTQKSSPACRRNVASILSAGPSHISELKY